MLIEKKEQKNIENVTNHRYENTTIRNKKKMIKAMIAFLIGAVGILLGAEPFIHSLEGFSVEIGISAVILAVIISPIAGEMPEKISMMILARKGAAGASIAIANVLGSKILNNTVLLAVAVFAAMANFGFYKVIEMSEILFYQIILVTTITFVAVIPMFRQKIGLRFGIFLLALYIFGILIQFMFPQDISIH
jgi:cation:H+ antiporter